MQYYTSVMVSALMSACSFSEHSVQLQPCNGDGIRIREDSPVYADCESKGLRALVFPDRDCVGIKVPDNRRLDSLSFSWATPFEDTKLAKFSLILPGGAQPALFANAAGRLKKTASTFKEVNSDARFLGFCFDGDNIDGHAYLYDWTLNLKRK